MEERFLIVVKCRGREGAVRGTERCGRLLSRGGGAAPASGRGLARQARWARVVRRGCDRLPPAGCITGAKGPRPPLPASRARGAGAGHRDDHLCGPQSGGTHAEAGDPLPQYRAVRPGRMRLGTDDAHGRRVGRSAHDVHRSDIVPGELTAQHPVRGVDLLAQRDGGRRRLARGAGSLESACPAAGVGEHVVQWQQSVQQGTQPRLRLVPLCRTAPRPGAAACRVRTAGRRRRPGRGRSRRLLGGVRGLGCGRWQGRGEHFGDEGGDGTAGGLVGTLQELVPIRVLTGLVERLRRQSAQR